MFEAICAARTPKSALNWLRSGGGAAILAQIASGTLPATHQALDAHPRRRAADQLRQLLVAGGVLPPRDEELARTGQWLTGILAAIEPAAGRRLVQAYATWHVMRRLRASAGKAGRPRTYTAHARNNIRAAADFTAWLARHGRPLQQCRQADIDDWLVTRPGAGHVRDFLTWAAARGHCPPLDVPGPARRSGTAASQDERWAQAARLLHDDTLDLTDRAAGCLLLLYGQQLSRIAAMTTSQVTSRDGTVFVRLRPPRRARPRPARRHPHRTDPHRPLPRRYRLPGQHAMAVPRRPARPPDHPGPARPAPAHPRHPRHGRTPCRAHRPGRPHTRRRPPDLLHLAPRTAVHWMREAGADWNRYAADLARSRNHQPGE